MKPYETRQTLIAKIIDQRDEKAWGEFAKIYEKFLFAVLHKYGFNNADSKDLVQATMLRVWECAPSFTYDASKGRFRSWLKQVNFNVMREFLRKENRLSHTLQKDELKLELLNQEEEGQLDYIYEQEWKELIGKKAWENVSQSIDGNVKEAFELYLTGMKSKEIASRLNISESSVRVYQQRVRIKLNKEVAKIESELG